MFNLFPIFGTPKDSISSKEFMGWKATQTPSMLQAQNELIEEFMKEIKNLREQQNFLYEENKNLKKENLELIERVNEIDNDVIRDLKDEIFVLKNDYAVLKAQKHPMYPLHWMGLDPLIHEQSKDLTIEQAIDKVKQKTPWVEEPIDWNEDIADENLKEPAFLSCACHEKTKQYNKQNEKYPTWEEVASDLALRVVKLEKQVVELKLINSQIHINKKS
jgi:phage shock protein A